MLNDRTAKSYFEFLSYSLHVINEFNTVGESGAGRLGGWLALFNFETLKTNLHGLKNS